MLVIDASVAIKWILDEKGSEEARIFLPGPAQDETHEGLLAPALLLIETHYAIAKRYLRGEATLAQLSAAVPLLAAVFGVLAPLDQGLAEAAASISFGATRSTKGAVVQPFGVYDCVYLALAMREKATLVTADVKQAKFAAQIGIPVRDLS
jgi:predicted nucleic acid-binding protein